MKVNREECIFLLCDVQESFRAVATNFDATVFACNLLMKTAAILNIPVIVTEQYPKGLKHTVSEINIKTSNVHGPYEKGLFSMITEEVEKVLVASSRKTVVIFGLETHVCVQQTALDLIEKGYKVLVVADAVTSRTLFDRKFGLKRMMASGVQVSTSESILMELLKSKDAKEFKQISQLIKENRPVSKY
eukprot:c21348_g1_i1.p1 GENE.c21348_g1_i1~~c21348_g1_i1.p1  ORF type:complete len:189 (+),score=63.73 c21348_g1_i1:57-623(+)